MPTRCARAPPLVLFSDAMRAQSHRAQALPVSQSVPASAGDADHRAGAAGGARAVRRLPGRAGARCRRLLRAARGPAARGGRLHRRHDRPLRDARARTPDRAARGPYECSAPAAMRRRACPPPRWPWSLAGVSAALHLGKLPPAVPALHDALGISLVEAGFLLSLVQLAGMTLGLLVGLVADALGLRRSMLAGLVDRRRWPALLGGSSAHAGRARRAPAAGAARARRRRLPAGRDAGPGPDPRAGAARRREGGAGPVGRLHAARRGAGAAARARR